MTSADQTAPLIQPVILCGGSGTRLWPMSRTLHPKQLLALAPGETLLQSTIRRGRGDQFSDPVIITGEDHRFLVREQVKETGATTEAIILEPAGRNTAAAVALASLNAARADPERLLLIMPSDHIIADPEAFVSAIEEGVPAALKGSIVTFGIRPSRAETGYGYIEAGPDCSPVRAVERFVEKPNAKLAEDYCKSGNHFWNGGLFLFKARVMIDALRDHAPQVLDACETAIADSIRDCEFLRPHAEAFLAAPAISIDYAVMEKVKNASIVPVDMGWSDVGSWDALWEISDKNSDGNVFHGDVVAVDVANSLIRSECDMTIAALGVEDLVVVATRDALLIVPRDKSQNTKLLVEKLKEAGIDKHFAFPLVHRPWGSYETVDRGERFQTKRIIVKPGEKLSLQLHHQRSEHWIVVQGTARVTVGEDVRLLQENESTYVPAGTVHRLENPGKIPLHLIEVQCGPYLGEDDIVRLEDTYGRLANVA